jgi:hypothetical protein
LGSDWSVIATGNEAGLRASAADSDIVQIYMTGLGAPDSSASSAGTGGGQWPADCLSTVNYLSALNLTTGAALATADGVFIDGNMIPANRLPPCLGGKETIPTVTIGGQPATVTYAGWVTGSVAGQYQVNIRLPGTSAGTFTSTAGTAVAAPLTGPVQLPVMVKARGLSSQPGVTIWVAPRLKVAAPGVVQGTAGTPWSTTGNLVKASGGTAPYQFAVTRGILPAGLALDAATGAVTGTPLPNGSYPVTVTATDSSASPMTGSVTFTIAIN